MILPPPGDVVHALDHAAARRQVAHHVAGVVFRRLDLDRHHRLEDHRRGLAAAVLEAERRGHLERVLVRVDLVVRAEGERDLDVDHRVAGEHAVRQRVLDALLDRGDELARHDAALDRVDELEALARLLRLDLEARRGRTGPCRPTGGRTCLRRRDTALRIVSRYATCGLPTLASTPNSRFMRSTMISRCSSPMPEMMVWPLSSSVLHAERRVFLGQAAEGDAHLLLVGLGLGLDGLRDHRLREHHLLERDDRRPDRTASRRSSRPSGRRRRRCRRPGSP